MKKSKIKILFSDLGGVLLSNGWDRQSRAKAVVKFELDEKDFESRHQLLFGDYETGKISLKTYLHDAIFYQPRPFSYELFVEFMYSQSQANPEMVDLIKKVKMEYDLKVVIISNEGKELTDYRIKTFKLGEFVDFFIVSGFIGMRKPDRSVWQLALDTVQIPPEETLYIEDRELFVQIAKEMGINALLHKNYATTKVELDRALRMRE